MKHSLGRLRWVWDLFDAIKIGFSSPLTGQLCYERTIRAEISKASRRTLACYRGCAVDDAADLVDDVDGFLV